MELKATRNITVDFPEIIIQPLIRLGIKWILFSVYPDDEIAFVESMFRDEYAANITFDSLMENPDEESKYALYDLIQGKYARLSENLEGE